MRICVGLMSQYTNENMNSRHAKDGANSTSSQHNYSYWIYQKHVYIAIYTFCEPAKKRYEATRNHEWVA